MSEAIISIQGLGKSYRLNHQRPGLLRDRISGLFRSRAESAAASTEEFWALRDVGFEVPAGQVVGIIGRNGAGKSTLLKILSRITQPTTGRISLRGRVASLLEVGTGFHSELTGRENIFLNGAILGMARAEIRQKFDEIVAFAEVDRFLDTPVKRYSSGMYVRLAFAVAAHLEPDILIVDEVLAVGDAQFQRKCLGKMKNVAAESGRTVLFVSHNLGMVSNLCQRGIWLSQGQLKFDGTAEAAVSAYLQHSTPENALAFDLSAAPRDPRYRGHVQITRVEFNGGEPVTNREPFSARFFFRTTGAVEGVSVGMGFSTLEGTRLLSLDSDYHQQRLDLPAGVDGSVELQLPYLSLGPGPYSIDVGARSGEIATLDYLPGCGLLEVHPRAGAPAGFGMIGGGVRAEAKWQWHLPGS